LLQLVAWKKTCHRRPAQRGVSCQPACGVEQTGRLQKFQSGTPAFLRRNRSRL
jgi:hypothetical protein